MLRAVSSLVASAALGTQPTGRLEDDKWVSRGSGDKMNSSVWTELPTQITGNGAIRPLDGAVSAWGECQL